MATPDLNQYKLVIFDLDGTLVDTSQGIFGSVRHVERSLGLAPLPDETLALFVGPPPCEAYREFHGLNLEEAKTAAKIHRAYSRKHAAEDSLRYQGVERMLDKLRQRGFSLGVATLKSQTIARKVLSHQRLISFFDAIVGMDDAETMTKSKAIATCREIIGEYGRAVLVGDTIHDRKGAHEAGVDFIAALWGYGFEHALPPESEPGVFGICSPDELALC